MMRHSHWRNSLGNRSIFMSSRSVSLSLSVNGKGTRGIKENGLISGEDLKMQVRKKMWLLIRSSV